MFEVPPLCENESDDAPNGSYDLISSFGTYTNQKPHRVSLKKLGWINGVNPLREREREGEMQSGAQSPRELTHLGAAGVRTPKPVLAQVLERMMWGG